MDKVNADAAAAAASAGAFITNAVKEAKAHGLEFTGEEFHAFMDAEAKAAASGELSDTQLGEVAGGYGYGTTDVLTSVVRSIACFPMVTAVTRTKKGM